MAPTKTKPNNKRQKKSKKAVVEIGKEEDEDNKPGCVYLGHIPHGFYEAQMTKYFSQFGKVLDVKLCRSKKTNNSKGYGFVKFRYSAVAKTVAETCHNYLFLNKLMKCEYKPMSEIHAKTFKKVFKPINVPKSLQNNFKSDHKLALSAKNSLTKAEKKLEKLKSSGLSVDLSDVMDVPTIPKISSESKTKAKQTPKESEVSTPEPPSAKRKKTGPSASSVTPAAATPKTPSAKRKRSDPSPSSTPVTVTTTPEAPSAKRKKTGPSTPKSPAATTPDASMGKKKKLASPNSKKSTPVSKAAKGTPKKSTTPDVSSAKTKKSTPSSQQPTPVSKAVKKTPKKSDGANESTPVTPSKTPKGKSPKSASAKVEPKLKEKKSPKTPTLNTPNLRKRKRV